jgi:AAA+ superfamily predicted ATPase
VAATEDSDPEKAEWTSFIKMFEQSVKPDWKLAALFRASFDEREKVVLLSLLCRAWLIRSKNTRSSLDRDLYTGDSLARSAADYIMDVPKIVRQCLLPSARLIRDEIIKPIVSGAGEMQEADEDAARGFSYELTDAFLASLGVKRQKSKSDIGRKPLLSLDRLVLAEPVREAISLAANQFSRRDKLDQWELAKAIPYGRAVTLLFSGPPGVGKTAAAEAIANHLGKNILVADYGKIQNLYVGETEKNIEKIFEEAHEGDCLLFWDEADAMLYDRDSADRNWEVRSVNVLLRELEKFDGVCILSTNRTVTLDKALARRISLKVEFEPPTRGQARQIWEKLLPAKMPLGQDVDLDRLARTPLTGGEIKNVVLNAARRAAGRDGNEAVMMEDFLYALKSEEAGKDLSGFSGRRIGFRNENCG